MLHLLELGNRGRGPRVFDVADVLDLDVLQRGEGAGKIAAPAAGPDQTEHDLLAGRPGLHGPRRAEHRGRGQGSGALDRAANETATCHVGHDRAPRCGATS